MCSLFALPAAGSTITVHITSVNLHINSALVEFGGSFKHGQLTRQMYRQMKKQIQTPKERDSGFEGKPGDVCLVEVDETWHRGRIISRCLDKYYVFLIDDGRTHWVSRTCLAWGQSSYFNIAPMMEFFILSGVLPLRLDNSWSPAASKFFKDLKGKTLHACVQDVMMPYKAILLDIPDVFMQMNHLGFARKIPFEKFKHIVSNSLSSLSEIASQISLTTTLSEIQLEYVGNHVKYLYPGLLPGTIEIVEVTQVIHPLNIFCKLNIFSQELTKLNAQINEYYESTSAFEMARPQSEGSPCATRGSDGKWYRSVLQQNIVSDIVKVLHVDYGMGDFVKAGNIRHLAAKFLRLPVVTYACSLYGILDKGTGWTASQIDYLRSVLLDHMFFGKFELQKFPGDVYHVTLYGNDNVNINKSFGIKEHCLSETAYFDCPFWTQSQGYLIDFPENRYEPIICSASSKESVSCEKIKRSGPARSELWPGEDNIGVQTHIRARPDFSNQGTLGSCLDEHLFTIGSVIEVNVSCMESDQRFWCQMAGSASRLKMLMHSIQNHYSCSQFQWPTGSDCVACHPENGMWYRARIVAHCLSSCIEVCLVDYGQRFQVPLQDLRPIDPQFLKLKCQAFQCSLLNPINFLNSENSTLNYNALSELLSSGCFRITIRGVVYDSKGIMLNLVDIENPSLKLCTSLLQKHCLVSKVNSLAKPLVSNGTCEVPDNINVGAKEKIWITCVKGVNQFYGQLGQNAAKIEKMTIEIQQVCAAVQQTRSKFLLQMMCLAKYDGKWHRGIIQSVNPRFIVHFVDYGDVLPLDESNILPFPAHPRESMSIPFQAILFRLFNITLEESSELNNWFKDYVIDCEFTATVVRKNPTGKLSVELHDGERNINVIVKEKWNEIQKKDHNTKEKVNKVSHKVIKPLWRQNQFDSKSQTSKDLSTNAFKSSDQSCFTMEKDEKDQQHFGVAACADGHYLLQDATQKQMNKDKPAMLLYPRYTDLPLRTLKLGLVSEVFVSHCNSPSSFFVQFSCEENEILSIVEKLNCSPLCDSQIDFQELQTDDLVKAEYPSDGAWYRAVVQNKLGDGRINVEFIDFGNEATLSGLKVRQLDTQFLKFPRYSVQCSLSGGDRDGKREWTKEQIAAFKNHTVTNGKKNLLCSFIKDDVSVWQVELEDQGIILSERLLKIVSAPELNPDNVVQTDCSSNDFPGKYKNPEIFVGQTIQGYASSIVGPDYFWCQSADTKLLDKVSMLAQETGNSAKTSPIKIDSLNPGDPCLALFSDDKMWHRAQVISKLVNTVFVLFVDYGNESEISQGSVKAITSSLMEFPPQAFLCQLEGFKSTDGSWNNVAADRLFEFLVDEPLKVCIKNTQVMSVSNKFPKFEVEIECNKGLVSDLMRHYWNSSLSPVCGQTACNGSLNLTEDYKTVTNLETCKKKGNLQSFFPEYTDIVVPPCDRNTDVLPVNELSEFAVNITKQGKVREIDTDSPALIEGISNTQDGFESSMLHLPQVSDLPPTCIECGFISEVYVSHINSPHSFFVQLVKDEDCIISLTEQLNSTCSFVHDKVQMSSIQCGGLVKSVFPDDESWYRAVIKDANGKDKVHVEFIDFGNEVTVSQTNVCKLDEQCLQLPRLSIHCCLSKDDCAHMQKNMVQGLCPVRQILGQVGEKKFCKFIKENNAVWKVKIADQRSTLECLEDISGEKWNDGQNTCTNDILSHVVKPADISLPIKKQKFSVGQTMDVYASFIDGPNYFWCQHENSEELDKISLIAQESGNSVDKNLLQRDQLCTGDPCIALFSDNIWYRAEVIKKSSGNFSILFVDYGNKSEIESEHVKLLPRPLLEIPAQAFLCQLEGFKPSDGFWAHNATDKFCELVLDKPLRMTIQKIENGLDGLTPPYYVRVQSKECVINEQMKSFWNASICTDLDTSEALQDIKSLVPKVQSILHNRVSVLPVESIRAVSDVSNCESEDGESFKRDGKLTESHLKNGLCFEEMDVHTTAQNISVCCEESHLTLKKILEGSAKFCGHDVEWRSQNSQNSSHQFKDLPHVRKTEPSNYGHDREFASSDVLYAGTSVTNQNSCAGNQMPLIPVNMDCSAKLSEHLSIGSHMSKLN